MRALILLPLSAFAILLLSCPSPQAQQALTSETAQFSRTIPSLACPVDLDLRHQGGLHALVPTASGTPSDPPPSDSIGQSTPPQQSLDLNVRNMSNKKIVSIDVVIQTKDSGPHLVPLLSRSGNTFPFKAGEPFSLHFARSIDIQQNRRFAPTLLTSNPIAYIELRRAAYQDGSIWEAPEGQACRFKLNPLMLVAAQ
jgi:hypothetical protein